MIPSRPKTVLHDFVSDSIAHLSHLEEHVSAERLDQAVAVLARAKRIHVLAQRRAFPVACYLASALGQLELSVSLLDGVGGMVREQARAIRAEDALVAVSFRSYSTEVIELTADAHRRGVPVVVITDSAVSPLVRGATVAFDLGDDSAYRAMSHEFHGTVASMSGNRILELLAHALMEIFDGHVARATRDIDTRAAIIEARTPYLEAAFKVVRADFGSVEGFATRALGLDKDALERLRHELLESP